MYELVSAVSWTVTMNLFNKLPGHTKTIAGLERSVLRRLPRLFVLGTLLLLLPSVLTRLLPWEGSAAEVATRITTIDIYTVSVVLLHWTVVFTVAIHAFIVLVMKGPAYVADAYPLAEAENPAESGLHS